MSRIEWIDTTTRDTWDLIDECRAVGCKARSVWIVESYDRHGTEYSDTVCLFHMAAYIGEHTYEGGAFTLTHYDRSAVMSAEEISRRVGVNMNGPSGDLTHLLGHIGIEH